jgi:hypothetical protein
VWQKIDGWWWCNVPILKNDGVKVNGKDDIPYMKWKIKNMFETTNQLMSVDSPPWDCTQAHAAYDKSMKQ